MLLVNSAGIASKGQQDDEVLFSCEAQLNTCTCAVSVRLSVCPSQNSLFGQLMTTYNSL